MDVIPPAGRKQWGMRKQVTLTDAERGRIASFVERTDMRQYVRSFLSKHMEAEAILGAAGLLRPVAGVDPGTPAVLRDVSERTLLVEIQRAGGFVNLSSSEGIVALDLSIAGHRWVSQGVAASLDPPFHESFELSLPPKAEEIGGSSLVVLLLSGDVRIVHGISDFEWRRCLGGCVSLPLEVRDPISDVAVGLVQIRLSVGKPLIANIDGLVREWGVQRAALVSPVFSPLIPTPLHALRFVSLLRSVPGRLFPPHVVLSCGAGSPESKAVLLASLLVGFGLEAYASGPVVVTVSPPLLWDPETGCRGEVDALPGDLMGVGVVLEPLAERPGFDFDDTRLWRRRVFAQSSVALSLVPCRPVDAVVLEMGVRRYIAEIRGGRETRFDRRLEAAVRPLLFQYEAAQMDVLGEAWGAGVDAAVRNVIPSGSTAKFLPVCVHSASLRDVVATLSARARDLLLNVGDTFAVAIAVFSFAEDVYATWVLTGAVASG